MPTNSSNADVLILPGWNSSGPDHWQTIWEKEHPEFSRVIQKDWINVNLQDWLAVLDEAIALRRKPVVLVAHSLSCILIAHWAQRGRPGVQSALLVAPADVECHETCPPEAWCFSPIPLQPLPFRSILVASDDDPYIQISRAKHLAQRWKADFVNIGAKGHINSASNLEAGVKARNCSPDCFRKQAWLLAIPLLVESSAQTHGLFMKSEKNSQLRQHKRRKARNY